MVCIAAKVGDCIAIASRLLFCVAVLALLGVAGRSSYALDILAADVIGKCLLEQSHADHIAYKGTSQIALVTLKGKELLANYSYSVRRKGELLDVSFVQAYSDGAKMQNRMTVGKKYCVAYRIPYPATNPNSILRQRGGIVSQERRNFERDRLLNCVFFFPGALDGYVCMGNRRVAEYLKEASDVQAVPDEASGYVRLSGRTSVGMVSLWLDEQRGYSIIRALVSKGQEDEHSMGTSVKDTPVAPEAGKKQIDKVSISLDGVSLEQVGGHWFAKSGTLVVAEHYLGGGTDTRTIIYNRTAIEVGPEFGEDVFHTDLPPGSPIVFTDKGATGVKYKWDGNGVVRDIGADGQVDSAPFQSESSGWWRTLTIAVNVAVVVAIAIWLVVRRR